MEETERELWTAMTRGGGWTEGRQCGKGGGGRDDLEVPGGVAIFLFLRTGEGGEERVLWGEEETHHVADLELGNLSRIKLQTLKKQGGCTCEANRKGERGKGTSTGRSREVERVHPQNIRTDTKQGMRRWSGG